MVLAVCCSWKCWGDRFWCHFPALCLEWVAAGDKGSKLQGLWQELRWEALGLWCVEKDSWRKQMYWIWVIQAKPRLLQPSLEIMASSGKVCRYRKQCVQSLSAVPGFMYRHFSFFFILFQYEGEPHQPNRRLSAEILYWEDFQAETNGKTHSWLLTPPLWATACCSLCYAWELHNPCPLNHRDDGGIIVVADFRFSSPAQVSIYQLPHALWRIHSGLCLYQLRECLDCDNVTCDNVIFQYLWILDPVGWTGTASRTCH